MNAKTMTTDKNLIPEVRNSMPKLKRYVPGTPINIKTMRNVIPVQSVTVLGPTGPETYRICANEYYAFAWPEPRPYETSMPICIQDVKYLFRPRNVWAWKQGSAIDPRERYERRMRIIPPKARLEKRELLSDFEQERLILCKTLLDLDAIIRKNYGMYVLSDELADAYWHHLRAHGI